MLEYLSWRSEFEFFEQPPLIYFDNAATTQILTKNLSLAYALDKANTSVMRYGNTLGDQLSRQLELSRHNIANYFGAQYNNLIFGNGATSSFNGLINSLSQSPTLFIATINLHHSVLGPILASSGSPNSIVYVDLDENYQIDLDSLKTILQKSPRNINIVICFPHIDNTMGVEQPIDKIAIMAKEYNALTLVDGCQAATSHKIDFIKSQVDIYVMSGHKFYSGHGTSIILLDSELSNTLKPWHYGGGAVKSFSYNEFALEDFPYSFEPGSPNVKSILCLNSTIDWIKTRDLDQDIAYTLELKEKLLNALENFELYSLNNNNSFILSMQHSDPVELDRISSHLRNSHVAIRYGRHCAQPLHETLGGPTLRFSLAPYNDEQDIENLVETLKNYKK